MMVRMDHHVGLRVANIERSIEFWTNGLGGTLANEPMERGGGYFDQLFGPGSRIKICYILFDAGAVELFEFVEPRSPVPVSSQTGDGLMHFGVHVDDVEEVLASCEAAGAKRRLDIQHMGGRPDAPRFVYVESPDGHVFELMEASAVDTVEQIRKTIELLEAEAAAAASPPA
jgi:catechol 2,3-dioxygenase-like lactoylglutathione lyase family enzyme